MNLTLTENKELLIDTIALIEIKGIGPGRFFELINTFGEPKNVLRQSIHNLTSIKGIGRELASAIHEQQNRKAAEEKVKRIENLGWKWFLYNSPDYPELLKSVTDRPPCLFYHGNYLPEDSKAITIVGSRTASDDGRQFAIRISRELAENNITVVSGMARGIDTSAHLGALNAGGRTIAIFGSSLDIIYPPENRNTAKLICENGCIFSEYLPGTEPFASNFTNRNRIISGLSQGVVIVEAADRSGALSTANHAIKQNREVFAVPGPPARRTSKGANSLIKKGARLLTSTNDIFEELPRLKGDIKVMRAEKLNDLTETEVKLINLFSDGPMQIDNILRSLDQPVSEVMPVLLALELKGLVKELSGKRFILE